MKKLYLIITLTLAITIVKAQWTAVNTGLTSLTVYTLESDGTNIFAGTNGGVFLSTNNGGTWSPVNSGITLTNLTINTIAISGTNIFIGTLSGGIFLSTNNGANWTAINNGLTTLNVWSLAINGANIFAGTAGGGVFLSTDNGGTWTAINTGLNTAYNVTSFAISGTNIFAGIVGGGIFLSTNNGNSWSAVNTGLTTTWIHSLIISGTKIYAGTDLGAFLSTNNGGNWILLNSGFGTFSTSITSMVLNGTNIMSGVYYNGVYLSTNSGNTWLQENSGLTDTLVNTLAISGTQIFAGTNGGVFTRPLSELTGIEEVQINSNLSISPNPFYSFTTITFSEEQKNTQLKITDILGNTIQQTIINGKQSTIDLSGAAKGIYFAEIIDANKNAVNKKIVVQ